MGSRLKGHGVPNWGKWDGAAGESDFYQGLELLMQVPKRAVTPPDRLDENRFWAATTAGVGHW